MSWVEKIQSNIRITTGDGRVYEPLYIIGVKETEYNVAEFNFPDIDGTLVNRSTAMGSRYTLDLIFQGENHLDTMLSFEQSNLDNRPWEVFHPIYGDLILQPTSIVYDPTGLNTSKVTCQCIETITEDAPKITVDPKDKIGFDYIVQQEILASNFANNVTLTAKDSVLISDNTEKLASLGSQAVKSGEQSNNYLLKYNELNNFIRFKFAETSQLATLVSQFIGFPSVFEDSTKNRFQLLKQQFESLQTQLDTFSDNVSKLIYELFGNGIVSAMANVSVNSTPDDFQNSNDVLEAIDIILEVYNQYISNIDLLQTDIGGATDSYIPNYEMTSGLSNLINYTVSQLLNIAVNSKQERILYLENDSNVIVLAHRFYGLTENDSTITQFINQNNIGLNEYLGLKKGRKIIYYV